MNAMPLEFRAGPAALNHIRERSVAVDDIAAISGAAGGPKWLVLSALDQYVFGDWLRERREPLPLVGASAGSWRFAAASQTNAVAAIRRLEQFYIEQQFSAKPDLQEVNRTANSVLEAVLGERGVDEILAHPWARLYVVTARCRGLSGYDDRLRMASGFALAVLANTASRAALASALQREVFAVEAGSALTAEHFPGFATRIHPLASDTVQQALLASGSIPFVMPACSVNGYAGRYRDGGLIDYHMDLPLADRGLVLMPHFSNKIVTGWLDKFLPWRRPKYLDNTLVIHPSAQWIASLPNGKLPDRNDFYLYADDYQGRLAAWREVVARSEELAVCFAERVQRDDWAELVQPL
ncbi:MAG: patatin-like phospholipase family protein [Spongiibacteraceae bacterium]